MGFRDELAAARARIESLERELREVTGERDRLARELSAARSELERVRDASSSTAVADAGQFCPSCGGKNAPDAYLCGLCGQPLASGITAPATRCPRCRGRTRSLLLADLDIDACPGCGGAWIARQTMEEMVLRARRGELDVDPAQVDLIWEGGGRARRQMYVRCPQCGETMARRQDPEARVVIDVCAEHGVWFDRGELTRVIEAVRKGKSRGGLDTPSSQPGDWTRASASEEGAGQHSWVDRMLDFLSTRVHWGDL